MKEKNKREHKPTRSCPHPWCKKVHTLTGLLGLAPVAYNLFHNWVWLVVIAGLSVLVTTVQKMINGGKSTIDLEMEDAKYEGTGWRTLVVNRKWANIAIGCDLVFLLAVGFTLTTFLAGTPGSRDTSLPSDPLLLILGFAPAVALLAFGAYAHKKATEPKKPKKAWLPGFVRTSNT